MIEQNELEIENINDLLLRKIISKDNANVRMVRAERVRVIKGRVSRDVRKALNNAVRDGTLCHLNKDKFKHEVYFHPQYEHLVAGIRDKYEREALDATSKVLMS